MWLERNVLRSLLYMLKNCISTYETHSSSIFVQSLLNEVISRFKQDPKRQAIPGPHPAPAPSQEPEFWLRAHVSNLYMKLG